MSINRSLVCLAIYLPLGSELCFVVFLMVALALKFTDHIVKYPMQSVPHPANAYPRVCIVQGYSARVQKSAVTHTNS